MDFYEFKGSLIQKASSKTVKTVTQSNPVSKIKDKIIIIMIIIIILIKEEENSIIHLNINEFYEHFAEIKLS